MVMMMHWECSDSDVLESRKPTAWTGQEHSPHVLPAWLGDDVEEQRLQGTWKLVSMAFVMPQRALLWLRG